MQSDSRRLAINVLFLMLLCVFILFDQIASAQPPQMAETVADLQSTHFSDMGDFQSTMWRRSNYASLGPGRYGNVKGYDIYLIGTGDRENMDPKAGLAFDAETYGGTLGIERMYGPLLISFAGAFNYRETNFDASNSQLISEIAHVGAYAMWDQGPWAIDFGFAYTHTEDETERAWVDVGTSTPYTALGVSQGDYLSGSLYGRFDFAFGTLTLTPTAGARYAKGDITPIIETGAGPFNASFNTSERESLVSSLGIIVATGYAPVLKLQAYALWDHEMEDRSTQLTGALISGGTPFTTTSYFESADVGRFGIFASRKHGMRLQFFGSYEAQLRDEMESHNAALGIRYRF